MSPIASFVIELQRVLNSFDSRQPDMRSLNVLQRNRTNRSPVSSVPVEIISGIGTFEFSA
eukprot:707818-Pleurochrysis_carterae.AAC.1